MSDGPKRAYKVGYGKPPRETQFKPCQSGNPAGRPKHAKNFATALDRELRTTVRFSENGRSRKLSKQELIAKRLVNGAIEANAKFMALLINLAMSLQKPTENDPDGIFDGSEYQPVIDGIVERIRACLDTPDLSNPASAAASTETSPEKPGGTGQC